MSLTFLVSPSALLPSPLNTCNCLTQNTFNALKAGNTALAQQLIATLGPATLTSNTSDLDWKNPVS